MEWKNLTLRESGILEHCYGIMTGKPQQLTVEVGQRPAVQQTGNPLDAHFTPACLSIIPTQKEVDRMKQFCDANRADYANYQTTPTGFTILPAKPL